MRSPISSESKLSFDLSDVTVLIKTKCEYKGESKYYFDKNKIKYGSKFIFKSDKYDLDGLVLDMNPLNEEAR